MRARARGQADRSERARPHAQTHSSRRFVSAESELGTLPVSRLAPRSLHHPNTTEPHYTGLRRIPQQHCPSVPAHRAAPLDLLYPAIREEVWSVPLKHSRVSQGSPVTTSSAVTRLLPHRLHAPSTAPPRTEQQLPIGVCTAVMKKKPRRTRGHAQSFDACERGERARHAPREQVVTEVAAPPEHH